MAKQKAEEITWEFRADYLPNGKVVISFGVSEQLSVSINETTFIELIESYKDFKEEQRGERTKTEDS